MRILSSFVVFSLSLFSVSAAYAGDSDADSVDDSLDAFPCLSSASSLQSLPAQNTTHTLFFEDQWPSRGDFDFNDFVVDTHVDIRKNAAGQISSMRLAYFPRAYGAVFDNGFAVRLPISKALAASSGIQIRKKAFSVAGGILSTENLSLRNDESDAVFVVMNHIRNEAFPDAAAVNAGIPTPINTQSGVSVIAPRFVVIEIDFAAPISTAALNTALFPFDVFIFRTGEYGHQIHQPQFGGTDAVRSDLFGTLNDGSTQSRFYVDTRGVPFALGVPSSSLWPKENTRIETVFPHLVDFAASGGVTNQNFHSDGVNTSAAFTGGPVALASAVDTDVDQSCLRQPVRGRFVAHHLNLQGTVSSLANIPTTNGNPRWFSIDPIAAANGFLFVSAGAFRQIDRVDVRTGASSPFVGNTSPTNVDGFGTTSALVQPFDMAAFDDVIYIADVNGHTVRKLLPTTQFLSTEIANTQSTALSGPRSVVSDANHLYYFQFLGSAQNKISKKNFSTGQITTLATLSGLTTSTGTISGMMIRDGFLYTIITAFNKVVRINTTTGATEDFVTLPSGFVSNGFGNTMFGDGQFLYVGEIGNSGRIFRIDWDTKITTELARVNAGIGSLTSDGQFLYALTGSGLFKVQ